MIILWSLVTPESVAATRKKTCHDKRTNLKAYNATVQVYTGIGSGLNCKKRGLIALVKILLTGRVKELVLTNKDRLLRFGSELIFLIGDCYEVKITILTDDGSEAAKTQMAEDS